MTLKKKNRNILCGQELATFIIRITRQLSVIYNNKM